MSAFSLESIFFSYSAAPILEDISLNIPRGEFVSIVGPNGSGKTTLLRLLDRILIPSQGKILLEGIDIQKYSRADLARRIAFVTQHHEVLFPFTAYELVLMGRSPYSRGAIFENPRDREIAADMMRQTDVWHLAHQPVNTLSGGERQRVFIARALAQQPGIILLDEPNAHLDIAHQVEVFAILKRLNRDFGVTVVTVSHDLNLAGAYSNRIGMIAGGNLIAVGTPAEVITAGTIRKTFGTDVLVDIHPATDQPRVTLLTS